jgi:hypothetical protein
VKRPRLAKCEWNVPTGPYCDAADDNDDKDDVIYNIAHTHLEQS